MTTNTPQDSTVPEEISTVQFKFPGRGVSAESPAPQAEKKPEPMLPNTPKEVFSLGSGVTPLVYRDSTYFSLGLPSRFFWYDFNELGACRIKGVHQAKFTRAARERNLPYTIEAVASTLSDPARCGDLTLQDYYFVMYWLRTSSYAKNPFYHTHICRNPEHQKLVLEGKKGPETLQTVVNVQATNLRETLLDVDQMTQVIQEVNAELAEYGITCGPPLVRDIVPCAEFAEEMMAKNGVESDHWDAETEYLLRYACLIRIIGDPTASIRKRVEVVNGLPADVLSSLETFETAQGSYGVEESLVTKCKECGAETRTTVQISAQTFLRSGG